MVQRQFIPTQKNQKQKLDPDTVCYINVVSWLNVWHESVSLFTACKMRFPAFYNYKVQVLLNHCESIKMLNPWSNAHDQYSKTVSSKQAIRTSVRLWRHSDWPQPCPHHGHQCKNIENWYGNTWAVPSSGLWELTNQFRLSFSGGGLKETGTKTVQSEGE